MTLETVLEKIKEVSPQISAEAEITDSQYKWPEKGLRALQNIGLGGLVVPEESSGLGMGLYALARACEEIGQCCTSTAMCYGMHNVGAAVISAKATNYHKEKYLKPIAEGKHLTTLALSEPGTGSHFYYPQTKLQSLPNDMLQVSGTKSFVTNGGMADSYVLSTVAIDPHAEPFQFSCVIADNDLENLSWGPLWKGFGMRGNSSRNLEIKDAQIPAANLLGEKGDELWFVFNVVAPYFLTAMSGTYLGLAQIAFNEARDHLKNRSYGHTGTTIGEHPLMQHKLGKMWSNIERTRRLLYYACKEADKGNYNALPALLAAKAEVAECAEYVTNEAMTLTGGISYRDNAVLSRLMRDARAAHVMAPTTDILYNWVGKSMLDLPLLSE